MSGGPKGPLSPPKELEVGGHRPPYLLVLIYLLPMWNLSMYQKMCVSCIIWFVLSALCLVSCILYYAFSLHCTPKGHSLWGTMLSYPIWRITSTVSLIIVCFCPGELQCNPSTTGIFLVSIQYLKLTRQMLIFGLQCTPCLNGQIQFYRVGFPYIIDMHAK